jgi:hypothetical protein
VVVVQDGEAVAVGDGSHEHVDGRKPIVARPGELALGLESAPLDVVVDVEAGEREQLGEQLIVVLRAASRVARFEQEGQARSDVPSLEGVGELESPLVGERRVGVVAVRRRRRRAARCEKIRAGDRSRMALTGGGT